MSKGEMVPFVRRKKAREKGKQDDDDSKPKRTNLGFSVVEKDFDVHSSEKEVRDQARSWGDVSRGKDRCCSHYAVRCVSRGARE